MYKFVLGAVAGTAQTVEEALKKMKELGTPVANETWKVTRSEPNLEGYTVERKVFDEVIQKGFIFPGRKWIVRDRKLKREKS